MIGKRKEEHIRIAENEDVSSFHNFWDDISLMHEADPEVNYDEIDTSVNFAGKNLKFPMIISSMTGGAEIAKNINRNLAIAAERFGIGMGVGSMRAAIVDRSIEDTYSVINESRVPLKIANIGAPQLVRQDKDAVSTRDIAYIYDLIKADFLAVHFNFLQEMVQPEGDRNSKGVIDRIRELSGSFNIIAKETGSGFSRKTAERLVDAGVKAIEVSGMSGTTFAAVEYYRAKKENNLEKMRVGETFWNWGIPSPASVHYCSDLVPVIGSGGLRNGLDLAKAIVMGATVGGFARTLLKDADTSPDQLMKNIELIQREFRVAMFLTGSKNVYELKFTKKIISEPLKDWLEAK
ncbi:type 2 isopentenyl-diphosphate Delta-isomerase [Thermoplasma sp.]|uniref:type 2 isopentenyl-diphosphate Delta-isomerase n=1 Tax=Thermoplasma sp. TaxID=1973142 RepID=UPI002615E395|nr:type 2 isopentenyl-diphosphate Delta-isomerase [Thermoplasma sp.]